MFMAKNYILYHIIKVKKCLKETDSGIDSKWPNLKNELYKYVHG